MAWAQQILVVIGTAAGYLLPGYFLARLLNAKAPYLTGFFTSTILIFHTVFFIDLFGGGITLANVGATLLAITIAGSLLVRRKFADSPLFEVPAPASWFELGRALSGWPERLIAITVALGFAMLAVRYMRYPLPGNDTYWRWEFIARLILERRSLDFYPAVTQQQLDVYPWCDGFPPLVPTIYWWGYALLGEASRRLTFVAVGMQMIFVGVLMFRLGRNMGGSARAGIWAVGVFAATPIAILAVVIGQETGFTILAMLGTACFLLESNGKNDWRAGLLAAICTSVGALAREYGLVFIILGALMFLQQRMSFRVLATYLAAAAAITSPWYLRNWIVYGNPFGAFDFLGLFPCNARNTSLLAQLVAISSVWKYSASMWWSLFWLLICTGCGPVFLGLAFLLTKPRTLMWMIIPAVGCVFLFLHSIGYTNSLTYYSARVMMPGMLLAGALLGSITSKWLENTNRTTTRPLVPLLAAACLAWSMFNAAPIPFLGATMDGSWWLAQTTRVLDGDRSADERADWLVKHIPAGSSLITVDYYLFAALHNRPVNAISFANPRADFLWDDKLTRSQIYEAAQKQNIHGVIVETDIFSALMLSRARILREDPEFTHFQKAHAGTRRIMVIPLTDDVQPNPSLP